MGNLYPGRVSLPWSPCGGALQAAKGGTPHGKTSRLHPGVVSEQATC